MDKERKGEKEKYLFKYAILWTAKSSIILIVRQSPCGEVNYYRLKAIA